MTARSMATGRWSEQIASRRDGPAATHRCLSARELNGSAHARLAKTIEVFNEQGRDAQLKLFSLPLSRSRPDESELASTGGSFRSSGGWSATRRFGDCYLDGVMERLGLDEFSLRSISTEMLRCGLVASSLGMSDSTGCASGQRTGPWSNPGIRPRRGRSGCPSEKRAKSTSKRGCLVVSKKTLLPLKTKLEHI